jgi:hypothetical protein
MKKMILKRSIPIWAVLLVAIIAVAGTVVALTVGATSQKVTLFQGQYTSTDFTVQSVTTIVSGLNSVTLTITLKNNAADARSGTITVQLLDTDNNQITGLTIDPANGQATITDLAAGATQQIPFTFTKDGLLSTYSSHLIDFRQTS